MSNSTSLDNSTFWGGISALIGFLTVLFTGIFTIANNIYKIRSAEAEEKAAQKEEKINLAHQEKLQHMKEYISLLREQVTASKKLLEAPSFASFDSSTPSDDTDRPKKVRVKHE